MYPYGCRYWQTKREPRLAPGTLPTRGLIDDASVPQNWRDLPFVKLIADGQVDHGDQHSACCLRCVRRLLDSASVSQLHELRVPLDADALRRNLTGLHGSWRQVDVVAETGSTNADLIARAVAGEDVVGAVLIAENQVAGRGRAGRQWASGPYTQIVVSAAYAADTVPADRWGWLPLAVGVAVVDAVAAVAGVPSWVKWPNDVLAGDPHRKLAGILCEVAYPGPVIVSGIGVNVTLTADEVGESTAVSLLELGATSTDRDALLARLLVELGERLDQWRTGDPRLAADWRARSVTLGRRVRAMLPGDRDVTGIAVDIDDEGRLQIEAADGIVTVAAGDIIHLRVP